MQTAPIDLDVHGSAIRVVCSDPGGAALLRRALGDHIVSREASLGFLLDAPSKARKLAVLTDRCGFVLARTRTVEQALAVLGGHLSALLPPVGGTVRLRTRAVVGAEGSVALAAFPLLAAPPVVERRLERSGWRILDRLTVDVDPESVELRLADVPWPELAALEPGPGHALPDARPGAVRLLLLPELDRDAPPSVATIVHSLASAVVSSGNREASLTAAERLASRVPRRSVPLDEPSEIYEALVAITA